MKSKTTILLLALCFQQAGEATVEKEGLFSGRMSTLSEVGSLIKVKVDFSNLKYLNKRDQVEFWGEQNKKRKCSAIVMGKSPDYLLLKLPNIAECKKYVNLSRGAYLYFYSTDLINNIKMGSEVVDILLKKRLAVKSKVERRRKELAQHIEKINAVNEKYDVLLSKLQEEWDREINHLEEDKIETSRNFQGLMTRLDEIDYKLERYRIEDENLKIDRWSLDPREYFRK